MWHVQPPDASWGSLATEGADWVWFSRGVETDVPDNQEGTVNKGTVELPQRAQYAAWARYMAASS